MAFSAYEKFIEEKTAFSLRDLYDLPSSKVTFDGGAHYRMEIAGIESVSNFEVMLKESEKRNVPIHRIVAAVKGATLMDNQELKHFAQIGAESKTEVMMLPAASRGWDIGKQYSTKEGYVCGMRMRGQDMVTNWLRELDRCINAGIRGFLVPDEGMIYLLNKMRLDGIIPADVKFKASVFTGHASGVGAKMLQELGADSCNPLADLPLPMLASIRSAVDMPLDVYISVVDAMGGIQRYHEASEIARICAPVYFKFEPGPSEAELYNTWVDMDYLDFLVREKVKFAQITKEWVERVDKDNKLVFNNYREDLSAPKA